MRWRGVRTAPHSLRREATGKIWMEGETFAARCNRAVRRGVGSWREQPRRRGRHSRLSDNVDKSYANVFTGGAFLLRQKSAKFVIIQRREKTARTGGGRGRDAGHCTHHRSTRLKHSTRRCANTMLHLFIAGSLRRRGARRARPHITAQIPTRLRCGAFHPTAAPVGRSTGRKAPQCTRTRFTS